MRQELEIGIRMTIEDGITFFGIEELRERIRNGARVISIDEGGAIFQKTGEDEDNVSMYFSGGAFKVTVEGNQ